MITELKKRSADAPQLTAGLHPDALRAENAVDVLNLPDTIARLHGSQCIGSYLLVSERPRTVTH